MSAHILTASVPETADILEKPDTLEKEKEGVGERPLESQVVSDLRKAGVLRAEAIAAQFSKGYKIALFATIILASFTTELAFVLNTSYRGYGTAAFGKHAFLSTIGVINAVLAAVGQPVAAKLADIFGRWELLSVAYALFTMGQVIQAATPSLSGFTAGCVFSQIGFTTSFITVLIIIADFSTVNQRMLLNYCAFSPVIITTWISGYIMNGVLKYSSNDAIIEHETWRWGVGMFAILLPFTVFQTPLVLWLGQRKAAKAGALPSTGSRFNRVVLQEFVKSIDLLGMLLLVASLCLILVPITLAGSAAGGTSETWKKAHILAPLIIGAVLLPLFFYWETRATYPIVPFRLIKDRGVWPALIFAGLFNASFALNATYMFPMLIVPYQASIAAAARFSNYLSMANVVAGVITGALVVKIRRVKPFIIAGVSVFLVGYGIFIRFRVAPHYGAAVAAGVVTGIGMGMSTYATEVGANARSKHENVAVIIGLFFGCGYIGSAVGSAIAGGVWTQVMPNKLVAHLGPQIGAQVYADPYTMAYFYPPGTAIRATWNGVYSDVQKTLCIIGISLGAGVFLMTLLLRNTKLSKLQTSTDAEQ